MIGERSPSVRHDSNDTGRWRIPGRDESPLRYFFSAALIGSLTAVKVANSTL